MKDKKALAIILAQKAKPKMSPDQDSDEGMEAEGSEDEGKMAAAEELLAALKEGNAQRLLYAFEDLKAMCD